MHSVLKRAMNHSSPYRLALQLQLCQFLLFHTSTAPLSHFPPPAHKTGLLAKSEGNYWVRCRSSNYGLDSRTCISFPEKPLLENQVSRIKADGLARLSNETQQEQTCWLRKHKREPFLVPGTRSSVRRFHDSAEHI